MSVSSPVAKRNHAIECANDRYKKIMGNIQHGAITKSDLDKITMTHKQAFREAITVFEQEMQKSQ